MSTDDELFTSSEVLGGFPAKRARLLLFQIESRTAYLMMQSRRTVDLYLTEEIAEQQDLAFFEALAQGREPPVRPTMRDLERYAPRWQDLVPPNRILQATLVHLLEQKYCFAQRDIPQIREAVGLDTEGVQQAFQRQYPSFSQQELAPLSGGCRRNVAASTTWGSNCDPAQRHSSARASDSTRAF